MGREKNNILPEIVAFIQNKQMMFFAKGQGFHEKGESIKLYPFRNRFRVEINEKSIRDSALSVGYRLPLYVKKNKSGGKMIAAILGIVLLFFNIAASEIQQKKITKNDEIQRYIELADSLKYSNPDKSIKLATIALQGLQETKDNLGRIRLFNCLSNSYYNFNNGEKALDWANKSMQLAKATGNQAWIALARQSLGFAYNALGDLVKSREHASMALADFTASGDKKNIAQMFLLLGAIDFKQGNYSSALEKFLKSLGLNKALDDKNGIAACMLAIGSVYHDIGESKKALPYYLNCLKFFNKAGDERGIFKALGNLGTVYHAIGDYSKAKHYYMQALQIAEKRGEKSAISKICSNLGSLANEMGDYRQTILYCQKALKISKELKDKYMISISLENMAAGYAKLNLFRKAITTIFNALKVAEELNSPLLMSNSYERLAFIYSSMRNYKKSDEFYKKHRFNNDLVFNKELSQKIADLQARYESKEKEKQIEILKRDKAIREITMAKSETTTKFLFSGIISLMGILGLLITRFRLKIRINREMALKNQELSKTHANLEKAYSQIKTLGGLLPICCNCKKIRNDKGYWQQVEVYITQHSAAEFTHGICPSCKSILYSDYSKKNK